MHIPTAWKVLDTYKGVNIYDNDGYIIVVFSKFGTNNFQWCKSLTSAKRWITSNKSYFVETVTRTDGSTYDLRRDTIFY